MRRGLTNSWWLAGVLLIGAVLAVSFEIRSSDQAHQQAQRRQVQREVTQALAGSVGDVLNRERALGRVISSLRSASAEPWPVLSNIVTGQSAANGASFVEPVTETDRVRFERRTGIRIYDSTTAGTERPAPPRPLHLVLTETSQASGPVTPGLDLATSPIRTRVMLRAARTSRQLATPPVRFLGPVGHRYGVVVYLAVRTRQGRLLGWVTASYRARMLAETATSHLSGVRLTIRDGQTTLFSDYRHPSGSPSVLTVAGRQWRVWAAPTTSGALTTSWVVLGLGLGLALLTMMLLRQAGTRESYATRIAAEREAEQLALTRIATAVAERDDPEAIFSLVAEQVGELFDAVITGVTRYEPAENRGIIVGHWSRIPLRLAGASLSLDGGTAAALVFRTRRPARTETYQLSADPVRDSIVSAGAKAGIAAPIRVRGELWGSINAAYATDTIPAGTEVRLERFASLVGLAIANADAWDRLARQAKTDALTGLANRRTFDSRLGDELRRVERYQRDLSVAVLDVDHFKLINDRFGHQAGDKVLARLGEILSDNARDTDLVARVGGEEFAWIMPETDEEGALSAAERVREALATETFPELGRATVSAGLRTVSRGDTPQSVMRGADSALYAAKACGRNVVVAYVEDRDPQLT